MKAPLPQPSSWTKKINGDNDKISGYDDGEVLTSQRPSGYYAKDAVMGNEEEYYQALEGTNLY